MGAKLRLENQTSKDLLVQVELTGITKTIPPSGQAVIDTDFEKGEELHLELRTDRLVIWGGVAAEILDENQSMT
jgi:hypothetical protein